jgi:hypothetical protein
VSKGTARTATASQTVCWGTHRRVKRDSQDCYCLTNGLLGHAQACQKGQPELLLPHKRFVAARTGVSKGTARTATASQTVCCGTHRHVKRDSQNCYCLTNSLLGHAQACQKGQPGLLLPHKRFVGARTGVSKGTARTATASQTVCWGTHRNVKRDSQDCYCLTNSLLGHTQACQKGQPGLLLPYKQFVGARTGMSKGRVRTATASQTVCWGTHRRVKRDSQNCYCLTNSLLGHAQQLLLHSIIQIKKTLHITSENARREVLTAVFQRFRSSGM